MGARIQRPGRAAGTRQRLDAPGHHRGRVGEMLSGNPYAAEVNAGALLALLGDAPRVFDPDPRPARLEQMLRQAQSIGGR